MITTRKFQWTAQRIMACLAMILLWEFSFPQHLSAATITENQNNTGIIAQAPIQQALEPGFNRLPENPDRPQPIAKKKMRIPVSAYSSTVDQCDGDPFTTASGTRVRDGVIAANFLPIGAKVRFPEKFGNKIFVVEDRMNPRYNRHADIWMPTREEAKQWGVRYTTIEIL